MWLTQTYLVKPGSNFPAYAYFLFNPYSDWNSEMIKFIRNGLHILGHQTKGNLAILMPNERIDQQEIGKELDHKLGPLIAEIRAGKTISCGLFIVDLPLEQLEPDGSNARWVYYGFDEFIEAGVVKPGLYRLLEALEECANSSEGDTISRFVCTFESTKTSLKRTKLIDAASVSASGPSVSIGKLIGAFTDNNSVRTNIYK